MANKTVAVADLGSNTARLLLGRGNPDQSFKVMDEYQERVRLADYLGEDRQLAPEAAQRAIAAARSFARLCEASSASPILAVATGAMRLARNGPDVARQIYEATGLRFEIISGQREAVYRYIAVVNTLPITDRTIVDVD